MWLLFALLLYSRYDILWSERIRSVFQCGPYKSELEVILSENQTHFLAPTPCCCMPVQPQKIPHHYHGEQLSRACCMTPVSGLPGHFGNSSGTVCPVDHCDFSGLLSPANRSVREGTCSLPLLPSSTVQPAVLRSIAATQAGFFF